jgi:hypothetical protein
MRNKPYNLSSFSLLRCVGFVLFNTNHCHIFGRGGKIFMGVQILHSQLVLNFTCSFESGVQSYNIYLINFEFKCYFGTQFNLLNGHKPL